MNYIYLQIYGEELWPQGEAVLRQQAPEGAFSKLWSGFSLPVPCFKENKFALKVIKPKFKIQLHKE